VLGQTEKLRCQLLRCSMLCSHEIKAMQSPQDQAELWRVPHQLTQLARAGESLFHIRSCIAFGDRELRTQGELKGELSLGTLGSIRK
jgi:hypothetical protein